jgi:hypothetical protein
LAYASRRSGYLIAGVGGFLQVVSAWWGMFSHLHFGTLRPWWNPAELTLYTALAVTLFGVWQGLHARPKQPASFMTIKFVNLAGLKLAGVGCLIELIAGAWNETFHHTIRSRFGIEPAYALLILGMLTVNLAVLIGLTIEYGMIKRELVIASAARRAGVAFFVFLAFSAIWLAAAGTLIHLAGAFRPSSLNWMIAFFLALIGTLVLVPLKRVMPRFGSAVGVSVVFNAVAYSLLAVAASPVYIPWGILPVILFELALLPLGRRTRFERAVIIPSLVTGVFFGVTYYPFTVHLFPWSFSLQLLILSPVAGSGVGAVLGDRVYAALSSVVLGDVTSFL